MPPSHDAGMFAPIESSAIDLTNTEHLFLLSYRSVLREFHSKASAAIRTQDGYLGRVQLGMDPGNRPSRSGIQAIEYVARREEYYSFKRDFDETYLSKDFGRVQHKIIEFTKLPPTFAVSSGFAPPERAFEPTDEWVIINVFPAHGNMYVVLSYRSVDVNLVQNVVTMLSSASGDYQKYMLSKTVLENCENLVIRPSYFNSLSAERVKAITDFFVFSSQADVRDYNDPNLFLF